MSEYSVNAVDFTMQPIYFSFALKSFNGLYDDKAPLLHLQPSLHLTDQFDCFCVNNV